MKNIEELSKDELILLYIATKEALEDIIIQEHCHTDKNGKDYVCTYGLFAGGITMNHYCLCCALSNGYNRPT